MTKQEAILISAYTGFLLTNDRAGLHKFIQETLGRQVPIAQFTEELFAELREKLQKQIEELVAREDAEAVDVVRCKDCKRLYFKDMSAYCPHKVSACTPNHFCAYGEKREA